MEHNKTIIKFLSSEGFGKRSVFRTVTQMRRDRNGDPTDRVRVASRVRAGAVGFLLQSFPRSSYLNHLAKLIKNWMDVPKVTQRETEPSPFCRGHNFIIMNCQ